MDSQSPKNLDTYTSFDIPNMGIAEVYALLIGAVIPRPIAVVSTVNSAGLENLAPFSFFNAVSSNPAMLSVSIARKPDGSKKDTLRNIEETKEFVVNSAGVPFREQIVACASTYPYGTSEREIVGFTSIPSTKVRPPRIKESLIHFECTLHTIVEIGDGSGGSSSLVLGKIVAMHVSKMTLKDNRIDALALQPLGRLGRAYYASLGEIFTHPVPELDK